MLRSTETHYASQQRFLLLALAAVRRALGVGDPRRAVPMLSVIQHEAARDAERSVAEMLREQGANLRQVAKVNTVALAGSSGDGRPLLRLIVDDRELWQLEQAATTAVQDAARMGAQLAIAATPGAGWTRMVNPPCCARCAILAGKWFGWNDGFLRHPLCDCRHIATTRDIAASVATNPERLFDNGHVKGLTQAEQKALAAGADLTRVVNARNDLWLDSPQHPSVARVFRRAGRDQDEAIRLLRAAGYLN